MNKKLFFRLFFYLSGLVILALGITLNTKVTLGVSPIISVSYCLSTITGANFGNMTFLWYAAFVLAEMIMHSTGLYAARVGHPIRKIGPVREEIIKDLLQLPVCLIFTRFMNLFSACIPVFETSYPNDFCGSLAGRLLILLIAIALTGIGAAMSLNMRVVPNPGDGIVQTISDLWGKSVGFTKNCFDTFCILTTIVVSLLVSGHLIGVGIGTVCAVIGVGRFVALYNHFLKKPTEQLAGL